VSAVNFVLGVLLLWLGSAMLFVAVHTTGATTPWQLYQDLIARVRGAAA
jgi:hypothetical protein